jgi:nucleoside-diphosphate-sugar epimerase
MFMEDAINATISLMEAEADKIKIRSSYNLGGISFNPKEIAEELKNHVPGFEITYKPDFRQAIAESWPQSINEDITRKHWGWKHKYDLKEMTKIMYEKIKEKLS